MEGGRRGCPGGQALARPSPPSAASKSSVIIAVALTIAMLYFGRQIFIPLALALVLSFLLTPLVGLFEKLRLGRVFAVVSSLTLSFLIAAGIGWIVTGQLVDITAHIGDYKENLDAKVRALHAPQTGALGQATATVRELNKELSAAPGQPATSPSAARPTHPLAVQVTAPPTNLLQDMRALLGPLAGPIETAGIVVIFTAFMLIKREDLRNRLIRLGGQGQLTVVTQALDDASRRLSRYLLLQFLVNAGYGALFGLGLYLIKVPHVLLWGTFAALLRFVPYVGTLIATAFPVAMAIAIFPGWNQALLTFALFVVLEIAIANIIEPWLYGSHTGISSLAILVTAIFWAVLWGPVGLILSTPLTVCLILIGHYVPQFKFLEVMLGDEPVLSPEEHFYQRLLAVDPDEARKIAEQQLEGKSLTSLYETVLIPALRLAEEDRHTDAVGDRTSAFIAQSTRELIEDLGDRVTEEESTRARGEGRPDESRWAFNGDATEILCVPARDDADALIGLMFTQLLQQARHSVRCIPIGAVEDMLEQVAQSRASIVCVSALPPFAVGQARSLCKRLRARLPGIQVVVGLWGFAGGVPRAQERVGPGCSDAVATTLSEALLQVRRLVELRNADSSGEQASSMLTPVVTIAKTPLAGK